MAAADSRQLENAKAERDEANRQKVKLEELLKKNEKENREKYSRQLNDMSTAFYNQRCGGLVIRPLRRRPAPSLGPSAELTAGGALNRLAHFREQLDSRAKKAPSFLARQQLRVIQMPAGSGSGPGPAAAAAAVGLGEAPAPAMVPDAIE